MLNLRIGIDTAQIKWLGYSQHNNSCLLAVSRISVSTGALEPINDMTEDQVMTLLPKPFIH